ncbi:MAG: hypothetical protein ACXW5U_16355 [Thermoanaerobaculia bacterium]
MSRTYSAKATVTDRQDADVPVGPVAVAVQPIKHDRLGARTRIELIRLGVALLVILLGLVAGAREQLAKLAFVAALVALFLPRVTAEQIKILMAPRTPAGEGG